MRVGALRTAHPALRSPLSKEAPCGPRSCWNQTVLSPSGHSPTGNATYAASNQVFAVSNPHKNKGTILY
jgi:hypothetical protein